MSRIGRRWRAVWIAAVLCLAVWTLAGRTARAIEVMLKDGRILRGKPVPWGSLAAVPQLGPDGIGPVKPILMLDDDLRRTFVSKRLVQDTRVDDLGQPVERFVIWQQRPSRQARVASVGPVIKIEDFDEYGRRTFIFNTPKGEVAVIQGITLITPRWTKVQGLTHDWDMRLATSSIPRDTLHKILLKQTDPKDIEHRKKIARFYLQCERYTDALKALEAIPADFPDQPNVPDQLTETIRALRQLAAQRSLSELKLRRKADQHRLVLQMLQKFPSEDVAGEILQEVREMIRQYRSLQARGEEVIKQIDAELAKVRDTALRGQIEAIRNEIAAELSANTLGRMTAFQHVVDDPDLLPTEKLSFAVSGWLLGSNAAMEKLPVALSLYKVRGLVRKYLNESLKMNRTQIFEKLKAEEGAVPGLVAGLIGHMKPAVAPPEPLTDKRPGYYQVQVNGLPNGPPVSYLVQLPLEYDPYRRYPAVVTLHGAGTTASQQVDWWSGGWGPGGFRQGQAARHGYIVIAPLWTVEHQRRYGYSLREHAAVLASLRDACKRFSVDTDRVFLSGHSMGGDAAWDIGLAHPDLWAGVIPIVARSDRYIAHYLENARQLPLYFVCGELDGTKMVDNARDLDRYLTGHTFNCTVVEYRGRGHEHFSDEVLRIFDWMDRFQRNFFPRTFTCKTMRPWDNFFWWVELDGLPPRSIVDPAEWPPDRATRPATVKARILATNGLNVSTGTAHVTVWLTPEMINFEQRASIVVNSSRINNRQPFIRPDLQTLLEDVRTRGDRQHPFWAKVESSTGRSSGRR